jgi:hypothetical protein
MPGNALAASMPAASHPHCILDSRNLRKLAFVLACAEFWAFAKGMLTNDQYVKVVRG